MHDRELPTAPGALIGYRKTGQPIYLIAGGSGEGEGDGGDGGTTGGEAGKQGQGDGAQQDSNADGAKQDGQTGGNTGVARDMGSLPDWAQAEIRRARNDAAKARTAPKDAADKARNDLVQQLGKALGLVKDEQSIDPAELTKQLGDERSKARTALVELAVHKAASKHDADPVGLTDSRGFMAKVDKLDPAADDFADQLGEAIKAAVADNPRLKAGGGQAPPPARSGGQHTGGTGGSDPAEMSMDEYVKHRRTRNE